MTHALAACTAGAVALAGCYQEYQPSTTPAPQFQAQPVYIQGPPGGEIDPSYTYTPAGGQIGEADPYGSEGGGEAGGEAYDAPSTEQQNPAEAMGNVTDVEIEATLDGYGYWVEDEEYGRIWRPDATVVGVDFTPYETCGTWMWTDYGWTFSCDWQWGWLPFHYGNWGWFDDYWAWVPDYTWSPGWVEWRTGGGYVGWRPIGPHTRDHRTGRADRDHRNNRGPVVRDHRGRRNGDADWRFVADRDFGNGRRIRPSLVHNNAEGLRTTNLVSRPPIRASASATARVTDVMKYRNRITARNPSASATGGWNGSGQRPTTNPYNPSRPSYDRARPARPTWGGNGSTYQPSTPGTRPGGAGSTWQPPSRGYNPPARSWTRPSRTYQPISPSSPSSPYAPPSRTYTPSSPSSPYAPPSRSYTPTSPSRTHMPPTPPPPSRTYTPSTPAPPSRTYTPSTPSRSWSPPSSSSAPSRSYTPPPSSSSSSSSSSSGRSAPASSSSSWSGGGSRRR